MKYTHALSIVAAFSLGSAQAVTVFTDTFNYTTNAAFTTEGGWTTAINTVTTGGGLGADAGSGIMFGNPGDGESALEYNYTTPLGAGDILKMNGNVDRGTGYLYGMRIILWDGLDAGTRLEVAGGVEGGVGPAGGANYDLTEVTYTVSGADITAGRTQVIFKFSNEGNWGQTNDVTFDVTPVPEPSGTAILGLAGLALILRRRK